MVSLFRSSTHDREALHSTVRSLREATVPGLAAALSWRPRKIERLLLEELTRPGTSMAYDPARRVVRWAPPTPSVEQPPPATGLPEPPPTSSAPRPKVDLGPPLRAPSPVVRGGSLRSLCPTCHVALSPSSSPSLSVCPQCGRLFSPRSLPDREGAAAPTAPDPAAAPPAHRASATTADRKSQELLAAYMTGAAIPCPRCRTALRHRALSEYGCPSCGEVVRFTPQRVVVEDKAGAPAAAVPAP